MKYFTKDLLEQLASENDDDVVAAQDQLEERSEKYRNYLKEIREYLPARFVVMQNEFYLHDAIFWPTFLPFGVLTKDGLPLDVMSFLRQYSEAVHVAPCMLCFTVELDAPPHSILILNYREAVLSFKPESLKTLDQKGFLEWNYDEVAILERDEQRRFSHSILFSNGFELTIEFADFDFATLKPMSRAIEEAVT